MYQLKLTEGAARRGALTTVHGTVQTPAFMNVATAAAIKGGISAYDLKELKCQVMLCNTYHLHLDLVIMWCVSWEDCTGLPVGRDPS